ncbi:UDP binding domain-containing protein [Methanothrix sp.]|uniref:UDP binding domain-containing protein n=1 Tax=Methanothrix sp. TaxID=90426 RepID=UPI0034E1C052
MDFMRIAIIGAGCAGLTTGAALAHIGHCVTCMESDGIKLAALEGGRYTIREQGVEEIMKDMGERLLFTGDISKAGGADALLPVTEWPEYRALDLNRIAGTMRTPVFLDGRNLLVSRKGQECRVHLHGYGKMRASLVRA